MNSLRNYIPLINLAQAINSVAIHLPVYNVKNSGHSSRISQGCQKGKSSYPEISFSKKSEHSYPLFLLNINTYTDKNTFS